MTLVYYGYPTPRTLAETTDPTFRACGLTRRKGEYIRDISRHILSGALDLESFRTVHGHRDDHQRAYEDPGYREVDRRAHHPEGTASSGCIPG